MMNGPIGQILREELWCL